MDGIQGQANLFIKSYWSYYMELETQLIETKRYVEFDVDNAKTFSIEYLKLYQAVCSEIDVVGKEIASYLNRDFKVDGRTNIQKWGYEIQKSFPMIKDKIVCFDEIYEVQPFENWAYEKYHDKNGYEKFRVFGGKKAVPWWTSYNKVKHQRIGLITGTKNFPLANQGNLIMAFAALYLLEYMYIKYLEECGAVFPDFNSSELFQIM